VRIHGVAAHAEDLSEGRRINEPLPLRGGGEQLGELWRELGGEIPHKLSLLLVIEGA
jgi:hypothetical protein